MTGFQPWRQEVDAWEISTYRVPEEGVRGE